MIKRETMVTVADNTGAKKAKCIGIIGYSSKDTATVGDVIVVTIREAVPGGAVSKSQVVRAVVVRTRKELRRKDGSYVRFDDNAVVLLNQQGEPLGTRVFGPVARELREKGFTRIISLAPEVV